MKVLGLIPARKGSKSIPGKNYVELGGKPLIQWVIDAGKGSKLLTDLIISTDDQRITDICEGQVKVYPRNPKLCKDDTPIIDVVENVLNLTELNLEKYDAVALLQPTSPFVTPKIIDASIEVLIHCKEAHSVQTVSHFSHNYHAYNQRVRDLRGYFYFRFQHERREYYNKQLKPDFFVFGNLVITRIEAVLEQGTLFAEPSIGMPVSRRAAIDVDGPEDLEYAEYLCQKNLPENKK